MYLPTPSPSGEAPPAALDEVGKAMLAAAAAIERFGHAKYALKSSKTGGVCLLGALNFAETGDAEGCGRCYPEASRRMGFSTSIAAVDWNNSPSTNAADVISRLRHAAGAR